MHFALDAEQQELARTVRELVARRATTVPARAAAERPSGYDEELWSRLCQEIGVAALAVPEEYGGAGFTPFETHLVLEQLGAALTPSPLLGSGVLAVQALLATGDAEGCGRLLPGLAEGTSIGAVAWADTSGRWRPDGSDITARRADDEWRLHGTATLVLDGMAAGVLLVVAESDDGVGLFEVDPGSPGVARERTPGLDQTLGFARVTLTDVVARPLAVDFADGLIRLRRLAAVAVTALQVGGAQECLDRTVGYLKERVQFERPLGSFQALKHRVADLLVLVETARSVSWSAAWAAAYDDSRLPTQAATARSWCTDAFDTVAGEMIQLHGGISITWEHDAHLYFKRAHATAQLFGPAREYRRELLDY